MFNVSYSLIQNAVGNYVIVKMLYLIEINRVDASDYNKVVLILFLCIIFASPLELVKRR